MILLFLYNTFEAVINIDNTYLKFHFVAVWGQVLESGEVNKHIRTNQTFRSDRSEGNESSEVIK